MPVYLYVDAPVASLQCDIVTTGSVTSALDPALGKTVMFNNGRVLVFGLNQLTFQGHFASVSAGVTGISGVVCADPDGNAVQATVSKLSSPEGLRVLAQP